VGVEWVFLVSGLLALGTLPGVGYLSETFTQVFRLKEIVLSFLFCTSNDNLQYPTLTDREDL
jgi:hypothetical protein